MSTRKEYVPGVTILVPKQEKKTKVVKLAKGKLKDMPGKVGGFKPGRLVINFAVALFDQPGAYLEVFDPPIEVEIAYTPADEKRARDAHQPLQLAFWDGEQWVVFTPEKHHFELISKGDGQGGVGKVSLSKWGDPPISWGP